MDSNEEANTSPTDLQEGQQERSRFENDPNIKQIGSWVGAADRQKHLMLIDAQVQRKKFDSFKELAKVEEWALDDDPLTKSEGNIDHLQISIEEEDQDELSGKT